jgi:hypothetical protein
MAEYAVQEVFSEAVDSYAPAAKKEPYTAPNGAHSGFVG